MNIEYPSIVILDDDPSAIFIAKEYITLVQPKARIRSFVQGDEALEFIKEQIPDLLFVDLRMPEMDGYEFLSAYSQYHHESTRVFVLSSSIDPRDKKSIDATSFIEGFITKPLDTKELKKIFS